MTVSIKSILAGEVPAGIYRYQGRAKPETLARLAEAVGWRFFHLEGAAIEGKAALIDALAAAADFPAYCGRNWDALEECLRDLSWAPALGYLIVWDDARVLAQADPQAFAIALSIFNTAARYWEAQGQPMTLLLRRAGRAEITA